MNKVKGFAVLFLSVTTLAVGGVFSINEIVNPYQYFASAVCEHEGNHYSQLDATKSESGTKEYWVCCKCHEHYLSLPSSGIWTDAGVAGSVTSGDDRYIDPIIDVQSELLAALKEMGMTGTANADGTTVTITSYNGSNSQVIIPEGVTGIKAGTFAGNKLEWIVLPSTISDSEIKGMVATGAGKVTLYFVGKTDYTPGKGDNQLQVKAIYQIEGTGWHYVKGVPTAGKGTSTF